MKVMSYNVMEGGVRPTAERLPLLKDVVLSESPDFVGLQEALPGDHRLLEELESSGKFAAVRCMDVEGDWSHGSTVAFASASSLSHRRLGERVRAMCVTVPSSSGEIDLVNVYLSHVDEDSRLSEIGEILSECRPSRPTLLFGDFNSLSPEDGLSPGIVENFSPRMRQKYCRDDRLCFDTVSEVLRAGYADVALRFHDPREITRKTDVAGGTGNHTQPVRLDYFFASPSALPLVKGLRLVDTATAMAASDHFPWVIEI